MILRDALDIRRGTAQRNKIYKGTYKVWDRNKKALEGYCRQNTTTGKNLLRQDQYVTTRTINGITFTNNGDGTFNITGTATAVTNINFLNGTSQIGLRSGKTYYLYSSQPYNNITFNLSMPFLQDGVRRYLIANSRITTSGEISDMKLAFYIESGNTVNAQNVKLMLVEGSTATDTDYEPYTGGQPSPNPDYPQEIEVMQGRQIVTIKGTQYTVDLKSKNIAYDVTYSSQKNRFYPLVRATYEVIEGHYYAISVDTSTTGLLCYLNLLPETLFERVSGNYNDLLDGTRKTWIVKALSTGIAQNVSIISRQTATDDTETGLLSNFMIEEIENPSDTSTDYEPYYDYKLAGIGDYKDNFYTDKGKWYFKQNIGNVVLNGGNDEEYVYQNNARFWLRRSYWNNETVPINPTNSIMGLYCNRFIERDRGDTWAGVEGISYDNPNTTLEPIGSSFDIACNSVATTAEAFKTWLSTHNLDIWYLLQNPQITEIPSTYTTLINQLNALYQAM